jgi:hypothetical protein
MGGLESIGEPATGFSVGNEIKRLAKEEAGIGFL